MKNLTNWIRQKGRKLHFKLLKKNKLDQEINLWIQLAIKPAYDLAQKLYPEDDFYQSRYSWKSPDDSKKIFIYGCLRQIQKAGVALMTQGEFIKEPSAPETSTTTRTIIESVLDEQHFWIRKLIEVFVNLLNFNPTDNGELFRLFLSSENYDLFRRKKSDFTEFHEKSSDNIQSSVDTYKERVVEDLKKLSLTQSWFITKDFKPTDYRERFKSAIMKASDAEQLLLGETYHGKYTMKSLSIHGTVAANPKEPEYSNIKLNITYISMLSQFIVRRAHLLLGTTDQGIERTINGSDWATMVTRLKKQIPRGSFVLVGGALGEVIEEHVSKYGYKCYKIKFLNRPLIPSQKEDWFDPTQIITLIPKDRVRSFYEVNTKQAPNKTLRDATLRMSDKHIHNAIREFLIELEKTNKLHKTFNIVPA